MIKLTLLAGMLAFGLAAPAMANPPASPLPDLLDDAVAPGLGATLSFDAPAPVAVAPQPAGPKLDIPTVDAPGFNARQAAAFNKLIQRVAREHQLDPQLLHAIITVESGYNAEAVSPKGAIGLMQLMPDTASRFGSSNPADPVENLRAGARYVKFLLGLFNRNMPLVLAAYNAGEGAVSKYRNTIPPYTETREYVAKVLASYQQRTGQSLVPASYVPETRIRMVLQADTPL